MTFLVCELYSGSGSALPGWEKAGFKVAWASDPEGPPRRIQRINGRKCHSSAPINRPNVDFFVSYVGQSNQRIKKAYEMIREDNPPVFMIESEFPINEKISSKYDMISFSLNSSWYFTGHTRTRFYLIGVLITRNPDPYSLMKLEESIKKEKVEVQNSVISMADDVGSHFIVTPFNKNFRAIHSSSRPLPELHSRSGKPLGQYLPHPSDSALLSESKMLRNDQITKICGLEGLLKPKGMERSLWFKWVGKSLDPNLANLIGKRVMEILISGKSTVTRKQNLINLKFLKKPICRTSKISLLCKTTDHEEIIEWCKKMDISIEVHPTIAVEYVIGRREDTDSCFNDLCKMKLPEECVVRIKTRLNKKNKLDDIVWIYQGILYRSKKKLKEVLDINY